MLFTVIPAQRAFKDANMKRCLFYFLLIFCVQTHAFQWADLWQTRDQQANQLMQEEHFEKAAALFERLDWKATAAYRAKQYDKAAQTYGALQTADGYYNQGNALAYQQNYQQAIEAYKKSLTLRPNDEDTLHNKALVEQLLKQQQSKKSSDKSESSQSKSTQSESSQSENNQDQSTKPSEPNQNTHQQNNSSKPSEESKSTEDPAKKDSTQSESKQTKQSSAQTKEKETSESNAQAKPDTQSMQINRQLLNMIPDDPGGLLKQKFLRDHLRHLEGEDE